MLAHIGLTGGAFPGMNGGGRGRRVFAVWGGSRIDKVGYLLDPGKVQVVYLLGPWRM